MAAELDNDALADEHTGDGDGDGAWLDINLPALVHNQLSAFGRRMGLTADGFAKLLLLQGLHPLLAAEPAMAQLPSDPVDDVDVSREMWTLQLRQFSDKMDQAPAPRFSGPDDRTYAAEDFTWPDGKSPAHQWVHIGRDGSMSLSKSLPPD